MNRGGAAGPTRGPVVGTADGAGPGRTGQRYVGGVHVRVVKPNRQIYIDRLVPVRKTEKKKKIYRWRHLRISS